MRTAHVWPEGALWIYHATIISDNASTTHTYTVTVGEGQEIEFWTIRMANAGAAARTLSALVDDGANTLYRIGSVGAAVVNERNWPGSSSGADGQPISGDKPAFLAGPMRLVVQWSAMLITEVSTLAITARVKSAAKPTVVRAVGAGTDTGVVNTNRIA